MIVKCDKCNNEFEVNMQVEKYRTPEGIEKHFFACKHCNKEYITNYTNPECKELHNQIQNLRKMIKVFPRKTVEYMDKIRKLSAVLQIKMEALEKKMSK